MTRLYRRRKVAEAVPYQAAVDRVCKAWATETMFEYFLPSQAADAIWPGHSMRRQGAAFAAGKILRRMHAEGYIGIGRRGWVLLGKGRIQAAQAPKAPTTP